MGFKKNSLCVHIQTFLKLGPAENHDENSDRFTLRFSCLPVCMMQSDMSGYKANRQAVAHPG